MRRAIGLLVGLSACTAPAPAPDGGSGGGSTASDCLTPPVLSEDLSQCQPLATDYQPRVAGSAGDTWAACISDDNTFHPIDPNISTVARVAAFEQIAALLWRDRKVPSAQEFLDARVIYAQDQGLDSRVQRREDVHYPRADAGPCSDPGVPAANPSRCVGPAQLLPILNDAFVRGARGEAPRLHAARIEAALLWFLYVSALSEASSCAAAPKDCDSCWAYYTGGTPRAQPKGLAAVVKSLSDETHQRGYDGALAVRCWRNLDNETGPAQDTALQLRARTQLDRALVRGVALVLRQRVAELECADAQGLAARLAFIEIVGGLLDREARSRDVSSADQLLSATRSRPLDGPAATAAIDRLFPCP